MMMLLALAAALAQQSGIGAIETDARTIDVSGADHRVTLPCNGRDVAVAGSGHVVVLTGVCASLDVSGANNQVEATLRPGGLLTVAGSDHKVRWRSAGEVRRDLSGADNEVVRLPD